MFPNPIAYLRFCRVVETAPRDIHGAIKIIDCMWDLAGTTPHKIKAKVDLLSQPEKEALKLFLLEQFNTGFKKQLDTLIESNPEFAFILKTVINTQMKYIFGDIYKPI